MKFFQVDAFTDKSLSGNPAAVCFPEEVFSDEMLLRIAQENNLSETAFLKKITDDNYELRWFTPGAEVDLCGHATLAAAHVLFTQMDLSEDIKKLKFQTKSGELTVEVEGDYLSMNFPALPSEKVEESPFYYHWEGVKEVRHLGTKNTFVVLDSPERLRTLKPDRDFIAKHTGEGVIVTAQDKSYDFISRYFAPNLDILEDPVTGFAHCALTWYWAQTLGKNEFKAYQASARGGEVFTKLEGDRVWLKGKAKLMIKGEMFI